jgi:pilus assembly protein Flp/PilA
MMNFIMRLFKEEEGQGMTEYAMILGGIAVAVVAAVALFGPALGVKWNAILALF